MTVLSLLLLSNGVKSQILAELSSGLSFTTVNPPEIQGFDLSARVDSTRGSDFQLGFSGDLTEKVRYLFRLGYNRHSIHAFHSKRQSQNFTEQLDGRLSSSYMSFMVAPLFHRGTKWEFTYGLGFYAGFRLQHSFTGIVRVIEDNEATIYPFNNVRPESYRETATGLFTTIGLSRSLGEKLRIGATADLILFLNAKNLIFQDIGSTNEINLRAGISYRIEPRMDNL